MENLDTEPVVKRAALAKCEHDGCTCTVEAGERFCSDYCLAQVGAEEASADHECQCGHPECEHVMAPTGVPGLEIR
jgi:hypothetical protein